MSSLPELSQRILAELEEAWHENVFAMLNTIIDPTGSNDEVAQYQSDLRVLLLASLIEVTLEGFFPRNPEKLTNTDAQKLLADLPAWVRFDNARGLWTLAEGEMRTERYPVMHLTKDGLAKAQEILSARGYQWWRHQGGNTPSA